jgi:shikimate dehydrogenase
VYNPRETVLLRRARDRGLGAVEGLGMLVHQGARALGLWFGVRAPIEVMTRALAASLSA